MTARRPLLLLPLLALLLSACGGSDPAAGPSPSASASASAAPSPTVRGAVVDWQSPRTVALSGRFGLADCAGDAPLVCVTVEGEVAGSLEVLSFPLASLPDLRGRTGRELLAAHASAYVSSFRQDRAQGCPPGYAVTPLEPVFLDATDGPVVRYGFAGALASGADSELQVQWAGVRGDQLVVLSAPAYEASGCLPPEGDSLGVAVLEELLPLLDAAVGASPLA